MLCDDAKSDVNFNIETLKLNTHYYTKVFHFNLFNPNFLENKNQSHIDLTRGKKHCYNCLGKGKEIYKTNRKIKIKKLKNYIGKEIGLLNIEQIHRALPLDARTNKQTNIVADIDISYRIYLSIIIMLHSLFYE